MKHVLSLGVFALAAACSHGTPVEPEARSAPPSVAPTAEAAEPTSEAAHGPMQAPFVLLLSRPTPEADGRELAVSATLLLERPSTDPIELEVRLPRGATLLSGTARQTLTALPRGKHGFSWRLALAQPLTEAEPLIVTADLRPAHDAYGAHAERRFPEASANTRRSPAVRPPPGRPPLPPSLRATTTHGSSTR